MTEERESPYFIEAAAKVLDVIESFSSYDEELSITEIAARANLTYSSAFRLLYTLEKRGYVMRRSRRKQYVLAPARKRFRIGYAALQTSAFHKEVTRGLAAAARRHMVSLVTRTNDEFDVSKALLNADSLIEEKIDLLIEYQYSDIAAELIAAKCQKAGVPAISLNLAQRGAHYFGGQNFQTGVLAGQFLSRAAQQRWRGVAGVCLVLAPKGMRSTQEPRIAGLKEALRSGLPGLPPTRVIATPQALSINESYNVTRQVLRHYGAVHDRILMAIMADHLAIGAEHAVREAGMEDRVVMVGQGGGRDARSLIARGGPFQGSVAFFGETYGERVISLALKILEGNNPPRTSFTNHVLLTADNLNDFYPRASTPVCEIACGAGATGAA